MVREAGRKTFNPPADLKKPIKWTGPTPTVIERYPLELPERFLERKKLHDAAVDAAETEVEREGERRLRMLAQHFGVDMSSKNFFQILSIRLAEALCPKGFLIDFGEKKSGPEKFWTVERYAELYADAEVVKREKHCLDSTACDVLVKRAIKAGKGRYLPDKDSTPKQAASTLQNRLSEAHSIVPRTYALLWFAWNEMAPDEPGERESFIADELIRLFGIPDLVRP